MARGRAGGLLRRAGMPLAVAVALAVVGVFGPIMGGALLAAGSEGTLGVVAASVMSVGACLLLYVDRRRFVVVRQFGAWSATRASVDSPQHA